ncbi:MAG: DDE-type integrase/transposase/recombinase [Aquisalimonadaceae bacterium]
MKEWFTAQELAALPGMPGTERGVRAWGNAGRIARRKRPKGKGWEYALASLPAEVQQHLRDQAATVAAQAVFDAPHATAQPQAEQAALDAKRRQQKEEGLRAWAALPKDTPKAQRAKARHIVLQAMWHHRRSQGGPERMADAVFTQKANAGEITLPAWVWDWMPHRAGARALTEATLRRWHYAYLREGIYGLVDGYGTRAGQSKVETTEPLRRLVIGTMLRYPHITPRKMQAWVEASQPELDIASEKAYERFMRRWREENAQTWTYLTNPDGWKSAYMAAVGSHHERITHLNQVWEMDSTPGDVMLTDGRHAVVGVIDLYSRRKKLFVSKTSTAAAICQVFRRAALDWGVPECVRTDNGSDYISNRFSDVLADLEIEHELCIPFASEQKGTIERALQTMSHGIVDLLPGFIGHSVADRKVIEARKSFASRIMDPEGVVDVALSSEEFQQVLDDYVEHVYSHDPHNGLDGQTPFQVATAWAEPVRRIRDERALDMLLADVGGTRTITKKGIRFENHLYDAPALFEYVGEEAVVKRDEQDIGRLAVYVGGTFVAIAECAELLGISRKERAAAARHAQREFLKGQSAEYRGYRNAVSKNIGTVVLEHRKSQTENLVALPHTGLDYTTDGLTEAGRAAHADLPTAPSTTDTQTTAEREAFKAQFAAELTAPVVDAETPPRRYQRWLRLDRRVQVGEPVSETEARWHARYPASDEYRSMAAFYADFNAQVNEQ